MFVMNTTANPEIAEQQRVLINPVILDRKGTIEGDEGCLSFPDLYQKVRRARNVVVRAYNLKGDSVEVQAAELAARVWQHEVDHLHGILFIDKVGAIAKLASRSTLKEFERDFRRSQERGEIPPDADLERVIATLEANA